MVIAGAHAANNQLLMQSHLTSFLFLYRYKLHKVESQSNSEDGTGFAALLGEGRYTLRLTFEVTGAAEFLSISSLECIGFPIEIGIVRMYPGAIALGLYFYIQENASCVLAHKVLVFY